MKKLLFFSLLICLAGCANIREPVLHPSALDKNKAYVAGEFYYEYRNSYLRLALELICGEEKESFLIELSLPKDHKGIEFYEVPEGVCRIEYLAPMGGIGDMDPNRKVHLFDRKFYSNFSTKSGEIQYLGIFVGRSDNQIGAFSVETTMELLHAVPSMDDLSEQFDQALGKENKLEYNSVFE